jgi:hypothetical protein
MDDTKITKGKVGLAFAASYLMFMLHAESASPENPANYLVALGGAIAVSLIAAIPALISQAIKPNYKKLVYMISLILLTLISIAGQAGYSMPGFGPDNFEQCMLKTMKGQPQSMQPFAVKECRRQFPH